MDAILDFALSAIWITAAVVVLVVAAVYYKLRYKIASAGQALVITGGKKAPKIKPGGGAFVPPNRKHAFFPIGVMTVSSPDKETQTITMVPIVVGWTAQLRADVDEESLQKAVRGFDSYDTEAVKASLQQTLDGEVRSVVATMTPAEVVTDKEKFKELVTKGVAPRMTELGFSLISLNISEVSDRKGHYDNLAAKDREEKRQEAETLTAQANQRVAVEQAAADRVSQEAQLDRDLAVDEKQKDVRLRQAEIKTETDTAEANAAIAGSLQAEIRSMELAARQGEVAVVRAQQDEAAAAAQREAELTRAETSKLRQAIDAAASAQKAEIDARAAAAVARAQAEGEAEANKARAIGEAEAAKAAAQGEADALTLRTAAKANELTLTGEAEAAATKARGEAEAASIQAKGEAEAEVQRKMAEALAANDGANLRVTLAEINRDTQISVYTAIGGVMARIGENATFVDMGGSSSGNSDLLTSILGRVPELMKQLDVKSEALNGLPFGESLGNVAAAISGKLTADDQKADNEPVDTDEVEIPQVDQTDEDNNDSVGIHDEIVPDESPDTAVISTYEDDDNRK